MNAPRCSPNDYIAYQIASPSRYTCTEAARCQPEAEQAPAHDAFTRLLQRPPADTADLWQEAQQLIPNQGVDKGIPHNSAVKQKTVCRFVYRKVVPRNSGSG